MLKFRLSAIVGVLFIYSLSGCAHHGDSHQPDDDNRGRTKLVAIGGAIILTAIAVQQAKRNTRDALRDARPDQ